MLGPASFSRSSRRRVPETGFFQEDPCVRPVVRAIASAGGGSTVANQTTMTLAGQSKTQDLLQVVAS
jgi:hypothetical protein